MLAKRRRTHKEAELDITSFMNLMIILVPVLLLSMVFAHTTVLDLNLPDLATESQSADEDDKPKVLEVIVRQDSLAVNYPAGVQIKDLPLKQITLENGDTQLGHDFELLTPVSYTHLTLPTNREV